MKPIHFIIFLIMLSAVPLRAEEADSILSPGNAAGQESSQESPVDIPESEAYILEPVIVRESGFRSLKAIDKAGTSTGISENDISDKSAKVLKDVLYQVPGIQVSTQRKGTTVFTMRGYDMSKVAMLVDGIPLIETYNGFMDIDNIGLLDISEIVVSRGTTSALYGTRGSAGSINMVTREPSEPYTTLSAEFGAHDNYVTSISHGAPAGKFYYYLSALFDKSNGYEISKKLDRSTREDWLQKLSRYDLYGFSLDDIYNNPGSSAAVYYLNDTGGWDHTSHEKYKFNTKIGYHATDELEMGITSFYNLTEMTNSNYFTDMRSIYTYNSLSQSTGWITPDTTYILRNRSNLWPQYDDYAVSPFFKYSGQSLNLEGNAFYYEQNNKYLAYDDPCENTLSFNRDEETMTWSIWNNRTYGFNLYPSWQMSSSHRLNFALSWYVSSHKEKEQAYNDESTETLENYGSGEYDTLNIEAAYLTLAVEDELLLGEKTALTLGVSYDAQDLMTFQKRRNVTGSTDMIDQYLAEDDAMLWGTRDAINPVAGVTYEPLEDFLTLKAAVSKKTSFPTLRAYSKTISPYQESSDLGSQDVKIKPETVYNANAGAKFCFLGGQLLWGADYFFSRYADKIMQIYVTKSDDYIYRNIDSATIHGVETTLDFYLFDVFDIADISLHSTYTYTFSINEADEELSLINKGDSIEYQPEHKVTFDIRTHFITDTSLFVFASMEFNQIQYTMSAVPQPTDSFSTAYFYETRLHDPVKIDVKLSQKIFDDYEVYVMCKNILDDYNADPFNPGPGRCWYAGFKVEL